MRVREATPEDAAACLAVYAPYVRDTVVSFELEPPDAATMAERIAAAHLWLVLEDPGVVGYAYAGAYAPRPAYRWACEVSIYLAPDLRRTGAGRALYEPLLAELTARGYRTALACMTLPNAASEGFHAALGFTAAGRFRRAGWKHGAWHDVAWMQRSLGPEDDAEPAAPR